MNGPNNTAESTEILYVGRLDSHKGVNELLQAIEQLRVSGGSVRCIVVGEQERWYEWPDEIADIVDQNEEAFEFTGFISEQELADTYATSDALVLPSEYETYGQVVVEALNYGTPVVMTPVGIGPERIEDGYNGVIYDPNEANSLVNALQQIRKDDGERLNKNAKESVSDLSWTEVVNHLENIYCGE
jgi:glycosyltransferase involved in cell wall biosynthesis